MPYGWRAAVAHVEFHVASCGCGWRMQESPGHFARLMQASERHVLEAGHEVTVARVTIARIRRVAAHVPGGTGHA